MKNKKHTQGLGSAHIGKRSYLFLCNEEDLKRGTFSVRESEDGVNFVMLTHNAKVVNINGPSDEFNQCGFLHASIDDKIYYLTYRICNEGLLCVARSRNLIDWEKLPQVEHVYGNGKIVSDYLYAGRNVMFTGGDAIRAHVSTDMVRWTRAKKDLISIALDKFQVELFILDVQVVDDGVFVMYAGQTHERGITQYKIYGALFEYGDPTKMIWRSHEPIYQTQNTKDQCATLFGAAVFDDYFVSYWMDHNGEMFLLKHIYHHQEDELAHAQTDAQTHDGKESYVPITLERVVHNPILEPQGCCAWEAKATYNPTAFVHDNTIHIIYRAEGHDMISVLGYATTTDGVTIDDRLPYCIYRRIITPTNTQLPRIPYSSGGNSFGGCEDPRAVLIEDMVHITYTAFDGWGSVRVALTSIALDDLIKRAWNWKRTVLISPPGEMNKNWVLFPEKINGKYAILHSFYPHILIDYFDDLNELDGKTRFIKSNNTRPIDPTREWDSWFRGVGPAPMRTDEGWLIIYHAMNCKNPDRYKVGALLLDIDDPTKVLYRSAAPILEPQEAYENDGHKWGVVYCCGAVIKDGQLLVYYGGSDKFVCVATAPLREFLEDLKRTGIVKMHTKH